MRFRENVRLLDRQYGSISNNHKSFLLILTIVKKVPLGTVIKVRLRWFRAVLQDSNLIISIIYEAKFTIFDTHVVEGHLEGTVSQFFYLGPSFNFMKSRK